MRAPRYLYVPMAGDGKRFYDDGYTTPKQFLKIRRRSCLHVSLDSLDLSYFDEVVVGCKIELDRAINLKPYLEGIFPETKFSIITLDNRTRGSLDTVRIMMEQATPQEDAEITIFTLDISFTTLDEIKPVESDAEVYIIKTNNPSFSYIKLQDGDTRYVAKTAEKRPISKFGAIGVYRFKEAKTLKSMMEEELIGPPSYGGEYYICPLLNRYISSALEVEAKLANSCIVFGTPSEYEFCLSLISPTSNKIACASDHSGFEAKKLFKEVATKLNYDVEDFGCYANTPCDYDDFVYPAVSSIIEGVNDFGFSFCRSGQGVNIAASTNKGIRSCLIYDVDQLETALRHNAPNHFSIPSGYVSFDSFEQILKLIKTTNFEGGRHQDRLIKTQSHV